VRFLIDNALPPRLALLLSGAGQDAVHVRQYAMQATADEFILTRAREEDRVIVSADTDFGTLLAAQRASHPSFILFRDPNLLSAEDYAGALLNHLPLLELDLANGCVVVFRSGRIRMRKLPISDI
jgi:predicted nuclease of predicted toxin-antitoxin system